MPRLLLLDEPTAGMGDQETYEITALIRRLHRESNYTIVLIEHDMRVVFHLADYITVLDQGSLLAEGTPKEIAASEAVQAAYLGEADDTARRHGAAHLLRQEPHSARRRPDGERGRDRHAARPQWRRQDHNAPQYHGTDPASRRQRQDIRDRSHAECRPTGWRDLASAMCRKAARSSPTSRSRTICGCRCCVPARGRSNASSRRFRGWRNDATTAAANFPAASRKCSRSPGRCCSIPSSCCSTSRARVLLPFW